MYIVNYLLFMGGEEQRLILNFDLINISLQCVDRVGHAYIEPIEFGFIRP